MNHEHPAAIPSILTLSSGWNEVDFQAGFCDTFITKSGIERISPHDEMV